MKILVIGASPFTLGDTFLTDKRYKVLQDILPFINGLDKVLQYHFLVKDPSINTSSKAFTNAIQLPDLKDVGAIITVDAASSNYFTDSKSSYMQMIVAGNYSYNGIPVYPVKIPYVLSEATALGFKLDEIYTKLTSGVTYKQTPTEVIICKTVMEWAKALRLCKESGVCTFDVETNQVDDKKHPVKYYQRGFKVRVLAVTPYAGVSYVLPVEHDDLVHLSTNLNSMMQMFFKEILENPNVIKVGQNIKYDLNALTKYEDKPTKYRGRFADTMLMFSLINENESASLARMTEIYLPTVSGYKISDYNIALEPLAKYCGEDTDYTCRLFYQFEIELRKDEAIYKIHRNLQMPAFWQLLFMERRGALIDKDYLEDSIGEIKRLIIKKGDELNSMPEVISYCNAKSNETYELDKVELETNVELKRLKTYWQNKLDNHVKVPHILNFGSPAQLKDFFYINPFGLRLTAYDGEGNRTYSTDKEALSSLNHEIVDRLQELKALEKTLSTFYLGIYNGLDENNYLHTNFRLNGTKTGRISCSEPNLQNLVTRTQIKDEEVAELILRVKKFFIAPDGYKILQADFSQLELRLIAMFSGDKNMIEAYMKGLDLHCLTASQINNMSYDEFMALEKSNPKEYKIQRFCGKGGNFSLSYGCMADTYRTYVKAMTGVVIDEVTGRLHHKNYFINYPSMLTWHTSYKQKALKYGHVRTFFGRKRHLPDIKSPVPAFKAAAERQAINSPVQGTGGELALFLLAIANTVLGDKVISFNTVHDSFIFYVKDADIEFVANTLKLISKNLDKYFSAYFICDLSRWTVPLELDIEVGDNWGEVEKYK